MGKLKLSVTGGDDDKLILSQIAGGNERAFGRLVDRWWPVVYNHTLHFIKSRPVAEEITLDIFEKIWNHRQKLVSLENFQNWLFIITRNQLISYARKKKNESSGLSATDLQADDDLIPGKSLELEDLANLIRLGIDQLKSHQREIFFLSRQSGLTHEQIALKLGLSRHTVKGHLVNSLNFLRRFLHDHGGATHAITFLLSAPNFF